MENCDKPWKSFKAVNLQVEAVLHGLNTSDLGAIAETEDGPTRHAAPPASSPPRFLSNRPVLGRYRPAGTGAIGNGFSPRRAVTFFADDRPPRRLAPQAPLRDLLRDERRVPRLRRVRSHPRARQQRRAEGCGVPPHPKLPRGCVSRERFIPSSIQSAPSFAQPFEFPRPFAFPPTNRRRARSR